MNSFIINNLTFNAYMPIYDNNYKLIIEVSLRILHSALIDENNAL